MSLAKEFMKYDLDTQKLIRAKLSKQKNDELDQMILNLSETPDLEPSGFIQAPPGTGGTLMGVARKSGRLIKKGAEKSADVAVRLPGELVDAYVQFGAGMVDTLDDIGSLIGAPPPAESARPEPAKTKFQEATRFAGTFATPYAGPGVTVGQGMGMLAKTPKVVSKLQYAKNVLTPIAKASGKPIAFVGEVLTSVPREVYEWAVTNPEYFDVPYQGKKTWQAIGKKAKKALEEVSEIGAKLVRKEKIALTKNPKYFDAKKFYNELYDQIEYHQLGSEFSPIPEKGQKLLRQLESKLGGRATDVDYDGMLSSIDLHQLKKTIDNWLDYNPNKVLDYGDEGVQILEQMRSSFNQTLRKHHQAYANVNDFHSNTLNVIDQVKTKFKPEFMANRIRQMIYKTGEYGDEYTQELLEEMDRIAPQEFKFLQDLKIAKANELFDSLFPGQGGGSGSAQGWGNIVRTFITARTKGLAAPIFSPRAHKEFIKRAPEKARKFGKTILTKTQAPAKAVADPIEILDELLEAQERKDRTKGQ